MSDDLLFLFRTYGRGEALRGWLTSVWHGGLHGMKLAEALGEPRDGRPGDIDCVASTDRILGALEKAGWIVRGKMELTPTRGAMGKGHAGAAYPIDHFWMPQRKAELFFDWLFPDMDAETRAACAKQYGWPARATSEAPPVEVKKASVKVAKKDECVGLRLTVTKAEILPHLAACAEVTDGKPPMPALACVAIESTATGVSLRATNIQQSVARDLSVMATNPGAIAVNARDLLAFVSALGSGPIDFAASPSKLAIVQGARRYSLPVFLVADIPTRAIVEPHGIEVGAAALAGLLLRVSPAMGSDPSLASQFGTHVVIGGGSIRAEATNGHTAAIASLPCDGSDTLDVVIPAPAAKHMAKILDGLDGVRVAKIGAAIHLFAPGFAYSSSIMSDRFPPVGQVVPERVGPVMRVDRKALAVAAKSMAACSAAGKVRLRPSAGGVTLSAEGDQKSGEEEVSADSTLRSFSSSAGYFSAGVGFHSSEKIEVWCKFNEARVIDAACGEILFASEGTNDVFVVMPIRYDTADLEADPG